MPGPQAKNRLKKSPYQGRNKKISKHMRRVTRMLDIRRASAPRKDGYRLPGSQNLRKRGYGKRAS